MGLVKLSCPSCGGEIEFDDKVKFGFCMFCGTKIMNEAAMPKTVTIDNTDKLNNCLHLAKDSFDCRDYKSMLDYANEALSIDATVPDGWFFKGLAFWKLGNSTTNAKLFFEKAKQYSASKGFYLVSKDLLKLIYGKETDEEYVVNEQFVDSCISELGLDVLSKEVSKFLNRTDLYTTRIMEYISALNSNYRYLVTNKETKEQIDSIVYRSIERINRIAPSTTVACWAELKDAMNHDFPLIFIGYALTGRYRDEIRSASFKFSHILSLKWNGMFGSAVKGVDMKDISTTKLNISNIQRLAQSI